MSGPAAHTYAIDSSHSILQSKPGACQALAASSPISISVALTRSHPLFACALVSHPSRHCVCGTAVHSARAPSFLLLVSTLPSVEPQDLSAEAPGQATRPFFAPVPLIWTRTDSGFGSCTIAGHSSLTFHSSVRAPVLSPKVGSRVGDNPYLIATSALQRVFALPPQCMST